MLHISNMSYVVRSCHGPRFSSCFMRCFVFMRAWEKSKNEGRKRKSRAILRPTDKKVKQTKLIEYNCVYERGVNAFCAAQRERKLLGHESRRLTCSPWHRRSFSLRDGNRSSGAMTSSFQMSQNSFHEKLLHTDELLMVRASKNTSSVQNQVSRLAAF